MMVPLLAPLAALLAPASSSAACTTWYDTTAHGSSFRSVKDFGATGDGTTDDTQAIQRAISSNVGAVDQKMPSLVYLPAGRYLINDTLVMYFHSHLVGSLSSEAGCRSEIVLAAAAAGFSSEAAPKPMLVTDNGFNRSTSSPWQKDSVDKNMLFYAQVHHLDFDTGKHAGAVGILWMVRHFSIIPGTFNEVKCRFYPLFL